MTTFYDDVDVHRLLVGDEVRTGAFFDSIAATVSRGDVVLDIGAGSGILSLFAAQAGAARVYAVERAPGAAALAQRLIADNRLLDRVYVVHADAEAVVLPEPVDVLVSEWLGVYGVDENMLGGVLVARDRWLKRGGTMIPGAVTAWLAPVAHPAGDEAVRFHANRYGVELGAMAPYSLDEAVWLPSGVPPASLRAAAQPMWTVDPESTSVVEARGPFRAQLSFRLEDGGVNGLVAWFSAAMPGAAELSNAPGRPATHWGQFLFPLAIAHDARAGDELSVTFECLPAGMRGSDHRWSVRFDGRLDVRDTRRVRGARWLPPWRTSYAGSSNLNGRSVTQ